VRISSPTQGAEYYIEEGKQQKIALECLTDNHTEVVYWFVNDKYIGRAQPKERMFILPDTGISTIVCRAGAQAKDIARIRVYAWGKSR